MYFDLKVPWYEWISIRFTNRRPVHVHYDLTTFSYTRNQSAPTHHIMMRIARQAICYAGWADITIGKPKICSDMARPVVYESTITHNEPTTCEGPWSNDDNERNSYSE